MATKQVSKINVFDRLDIKAPDWMGYDANLVDEAVAEGRSLQKEVTELRQKQEYSTREAKLTGIRWFFGILALVVGISYAVWGINWGVQDMSATTRNIQFQIDYYKTIYKQGWDDSKTGYPNSLLDANVKQMVEAMKARK